jgi:RNA polymerase sigma-70 factor (ECF subfamily)
MSGEVDDVELLAAIQAQDAVALRTLFERHSPWLAARLGRRCSDRDLVDDALQDTFVEVWRRPHRFEGRGEVAAWLWGIAIRRLIDGLRRRRAPFLDHSRPEVALSAEEQVLLNVEYGDLGGALDRLAPELRAVVQATVLDGLTTREASRLLGIPTGTVKTRMMRARAQLRAEFA